ncbi:MAG: ribulose-phosphate 3-epimerase [Bacilli bacterium]
MKVSVTYTVKILGIEETIKNIEESDADYIHVDFMDGEFVPTMNYTIDEVKQFLSDVKKKLDVHVMVKDPLKYLDVFASLNTEYYSFHIEAVDDVNKVITEIKKHGLKPGLVLNPETSVEKIKPYLDSIDLVLVMGVKPGWGGQSFIPSTIDKIKELKSLKGKFVIACDGGVNDNNARDIKLAGADILVAGSYIVKSDNYNERINKLKCQ